MPGKHGTDAERLLHSLMENVPGAIYRAANDSDWTNQRVSDEIETITGYPAADFLGAARQAITSVTHPDDRGPGRAGDHRRARREPSVPPGVPDHARRRRDPLGARRGVKTVDRYGVRVARRDHLRHLGAARGAGAAPSERELEERRVTELEASRARVVAAGDDARRRIERDLHDGAQQRLVVAALAVRAAERAAESDGPVAELLQEARSELGAGLAELRELARGIHPAVLDDRGSAGRAGARARSAVPVEVDDEITERLPAAVEAALDYAVSEALTNAPPPCCRLTCHGLHAVRRRASSRSRSPTTVAVAPTGRAGAACAISKTASGAIGGVLELDSPAAAGTRLRARVPL